jgi:hypothetical protein
LPVYYADVHIRGEDDIGPGAYDADPIHARTSSPDLARSLPRKDIVDKNPGSGDYSPNKEAVLYQSPIWTIGEKRNGENAP